MSINVRKWLRGLVAAVINGASTAVSTMIVDPRTFNFDTGLGNLGKVCLVAAIVGAALYLKEHPVWDDDDPPLPPQRLGLLLVVLALSASGVGCASLRPAPIRNPHLQLEGQIAVRGSQLVEAVRVAQRSLEPLVESQVLTPAEALKVAKVLGYALEQARHLVDILQLADQAREFAAKAKALAEATGVIKDLLRTVSVAGVDVGSTTGRVALDGLVGNVTDALGDLVMAGGGR
jgi:plasmid maintenance system antidote protein VapI